MKVAGLLVCFLACLPVLAQDVVINELQSSNELTIADEMGDFDDWIELLNIAENPIDLSGWGLQEIGGSTFIFPDDENFQLDPGEILLLFADGEPEEGWNHLPMKFSQLGEEVILLNASQVPEHTIEFGFMWSDVSVGYEEEDLDNLHYFTEATPGEPNTTEDYEGVLEIPSVSQPSGYVSGPFDIELSHPNPDVSIRYTTDGSWPDEESPLYEAPVSIINTTTIKAVAFAEDFIQSRVACESYIYTSGLATDIIALSGDEDDIFGPSNGIYTNPFQDWEVAVSVVMINQEGEKQFSQVLGVKVHGPDSRDQKSLRFYARGSYDYSNLNYPLFPDRETEQYKRFILRNAGNDGIEEGQSGLRDPVICNLYRSINPEYAASAARPVGVYLNDEYWGTYNLRERQDRFWMEEIYGYQADEIDLLERTASVPSTFNALEGDWNDFNLMEETAVELDLSDPENFAVMENWMDMENFIDYQLTEIFIINQDWLSNNLKLWRSYDQDSKWRWILWDVDWGFGTWYPNYPHGYPNWSAINFAMSNWGGWTSEVETELLQNLVENEEFLDSFCSRGADLLNSYLRSDHVIEELDSYKVPIAEDIALQTAQWGSDAETWQADIDYIEEFVTQRPDSMRQNFSEYFDLGEIYEIDLTCQPLQAGYIEVNTIYTDEIPWNGHYYENIPVRLKAIGNAGYTFSHWLETGETQNEIWVDLVSDSLLTAVFLEGEVPQYLVINEIMYDLPGNDDQREWIELYNPNQDTLDLDDWTLCDGGENCIEIDNLEVNPESYVVLAVSEDVFTVEYPGVENVVYLPLPALGNEEDQLALYNHNGLLIDTVAYELDAPWPMIEPGQSIQLDESTDDNNEGQNWFVNPMGHHTPGEPNELFVGVEELDLNSHFVAFPNPFNSQVSLVFRELVGEYVRAELYTPQGQLVETIFNGVVSERSQRVSLSDLEGLASGLYLVRLNVDGQSVYKTLIKER